MRKIKIAQIGVGHDHAGGSMSTLKSQNDIFDFVGFCRALEDENPIVTNTGDARELTLEEILNYEGLEAVAIETEDKNLTKYAQMAADRGLHIFLDKPGGTDDAEFDRMIDTAKSKKLVVHMGYMYRHNPAVIELKEQIKRGELGEISFIEAQMSCYHNPEKRDWLGRYKGGMMNFLGCHLVDFVYSCLGEPNEVLPLNYSSGLGGLLSEENGMAIFSYKNAKAYIRTSATEIGGFTRRRILVSGSRGSVEIAPIESFTSGANGIIQPQVSTKRDNFDTSWASLGEARNTEPFGRYDAMFKAFYSYITGEKKNPYDYEYEKNLHRLISKACGRGEDL